MKIPEEIEVSEHGPLIQGLLAIAWADGKIAPKERGRLAELLDETGIILEKEKLETWLETKPDPAWITQRVVDPLERRFLLRQSILLSKQDLDFAKDERALIELWAVAWSFTREQLRELEQDVDRLLSTWGDDLLHR